MINITLPDGSVKQFSSSVSGLEVAESISKSLAKDAIAMRLNGQLVDLKAVINEDSNLEIITTTTPEGLEIIRHDAAHILAEAVKKLYPDTQVTIGPTIEDGFYYDFARSTPFTPDDLAKIEAEMANIINENKEINKVVMSKEDAMDFFKRQGEEFKVEIIEGIPEETVNIYFQGEFADLCRGPHAPSTGKVKAFKLTKVAGAYWRGDSNNPMLQRIYGTAWASKKQLKEYLELLEEAQKRDHRKLAKDMDLLHFQDEAPGAIFWHPKGWRMFQRLIDYLRRKQEEADYVEINTPEILTRSLWEASGHWEKFGENMFTAQVADEEKLYAVRPMNCPGSVQVFKQGIRSYKELPLKIAEFGKVYRYEPSGSLHGMFRVRAFTQDDAHIFCTEDQLSTECQKVCKFVLEVYKDFGFENVRVKFSDRPTKRVGSDEIWDKSEKSLKEAIEALGLEYTLNPGEGAFYGPKIEFVLRDALKRDWQLGTLQVDLNLPSRLGATYIGEDGAKHYPVMLHRAIFGSLERFMGMLLEHYAGKLPLWLAPVQVVVASITNEVDDYARYVYDELRKNGIRAQLDLDSDKIGYKIRKHSLAKTPLIVALGAQEQANKTVTVRTLGSNAQDTLELNQFITKLFDTIDSKRRSL